MTGAGGPRTAAPHAGHDRAARGVLVTGLPRSGTSWVGKMLEASGELVYVNEPMNPSHPPGRSPGVLDAEVEHYFHYVCDQNAAGWLEAFDDTLRLRFRPVRELRRNHRPYDLARAVKYALGFTVGRLRGRRALLDDPYALPSTPWLVDRAGMSAVVLVRDPVSLAGSWRRLGWRVDPAELLAQPLLMRDHLEPWRDELERAAGPAGARDPLASLCALWNATTGLVLAFDADHPRIAVRRYEEVASAPMSAFAKLYERLGLTWSASAQQRVHTATSDAAGSSSRGFAWSVRGGPSRTAYRPMDSGAMLAAQRAVLPTEDAARVLALTEEMRAAFAAHRSGH